MTSDSTAGPLLTTELTEQEFVRWYWLKVELEAFAREVGLRATGSKELLTARISAALADRAFAEPVAVRRPNGRQFEAPLTPATVIPVGQRSSQVVREWMRAQVGPGFHFDAAMREFFAQSDGTTTMQDAVDHYHATRQSRRTDIDPQFEYNRFTRDWHAQHPEGSREDLLAAWRTYRETPTDLRS